jgi:hypothetical protein
MSSMMSGIAPGEDEAHVRDLRELTNGIGAPRQPYYKRGTAVANPSPTYYRGFKSLVLLRMYIRLRCVACRCTQMCTSSPLLELVWLIRYEVMLAYLSQVQWDLSCHVVPGWWTYNRNLQPVHLPVDLLDVSISIRRCGQREMYAWEEGREDLFCNNSVHLCMRKGQESALISISANLKPLHQLYQWLCTQYKMKHHAHACTAASEERHPALTTAFSSSATLKVFCHLHQTIHSRIFDAVLDPQTCTGRRITFTISQMKALTGR